MASPESVCCELFELFEEQNEQEKRAHVRIACSVWIASGLYLYATSPVTSFFSVSAIGFFVIGPFAASLLIGGGAYLVRRRVAAALERAVPIAAPWTVVAITTICWLLFVSELAVGYEFAKAAFVSLSGS
jgi:hypothetical protein